MKLQGGAALVNFSYEAAPLKFHFFLQNTFQNRSHAIGGENHKNENVVEEETKTEELRSGGRSWPQEVPETRMGRERLCPGARFSQPVS